MCIKCKPDTEVPMLEGKNTPTQCKLKCVGNRAMKKTETGYSFICAAFASMCCSISNAKNITFAFYKFENLQITFFHILKGSSAYTYIQSFYNFELTSLVLCLNTILEPPH